MPLFTPINPPPGLAVEQGGEAAQSATLADAEDQIRSTLREYTAAVRLWVDGAYSEATRAFQDVSQQTIVAHASDSPAESDYDTLCKEHGGMSMNRLRSLILAGAGMTQMAAGGLKSTWQLVPGLDFPSLFSMIAGMDASMRSALCQAQAHFQAALKFSSTDPLHLLALGQCSMLLGDHGSALSAFREALDRTPDYCQSITDSFPGQHWGPYQLCCAMAMAQAALLRGDVDMVMAMTDKAAEQSRDLARALRLLLGEAGVLPAPAHASVSASASYLTLPPPPPPPSEYSISDAHGTVSIPATDSGASIVALGEQILDCYAGMAQECVGRSSSSTLFSQVNLEIRAAAFGKPTGAALAEEETKDSGNTDTGTDLAHQTTAAEEGISDGLDRSSPSPEDSTSNGTSRLHKRQLSLSGDEMPMKRRSTRFAERGSFGAASQGMPGPPAASAVAWPRATGPRGAIRRPLAVSPETFGSDAFSRACDMTWMWLDSAKIARREDVSKALGNYTTLAELFAKQFRGSRKHSGRRRLQTDSGDGHSDWSFAAQSGNLLDAARAVDDISDKYSSSLAALTADAGGSDLQADSDASDPGLSWLLSIPSCQKLFDGNCGIFGVLQSFADTVMLAIYSFPEVFFKSPRLKNIFFRVLNTIHEVLLDRADAGLTAECSPDECRQVVRWGTFAILVLASAATSMNSCQDLCNHMRHEWIAVSNRAISRLQAPDSDLCIAQYRIAEAWTDYELGVIANDIGRAAASVSKCQDLLLHTPEASSVALVAHCSITGAPVNLELIEQRQSHLLRFVQLRDAARMVRVDKEQAIGLLGAFAEPFAEVPDCGLAFSQRIAAVRLLTALYHDLAMDTDEIRSIMYELYLILSQLAANSSDTTIPMRLVIDRCVTCLQRIHSMAATSRAVDQYIESLHAEANVTSRLPQCLLLMSLALTQHFYIGPLPDSPLSSPEAAFVGLALWLAAKLTCGIALPLPMSPTDLQPKDARADTGNVSPISNCSSQTTQSGDSDSTKELDSYMRAFGSIHGVLGERGLCTAANGALLRHLLRVCREHLSECPEHSAYWDVSGACLQCLFDIKLHSSSPDRHPCVHLDMNHESANAVYLLVESELLDTLRSRKGAGLRGDLKAIVEKTSAALSDVDISLLPRIGMNMDIIDDYLDGATMPVFSQLERALRSNFDVLHVACLPPKDSYADDGVPTACLSLPFVRATMQHDILRARMRSGVPRAVEDYDEVLEDYKLNVSLNPASAEAWHQLGQAHSDLADELLLGTASEIMKNKYDIAILLRSALSCTVQAKQLLAPLPATARAAQDELACEDSSPSGDIPGQLHTRVYSLAGRLLYRIAARPLPLLALKVLPSNILVSDDSNGGDESRQEWDVGRWAGSRSTVSMYQALTRRYTTLPSKMHIYRLARAMLLHTSRLDPANWKWCYMLGKATAKLQDPLTACAYYLKAYHLAAADTMDTSLPAAAAPSQPLTSFSVPEPAMDAIYKLLATLTKLVWQQRLDVPIAQRFLDALSCSVTGECADLATRSAPSGEDAVPVHSTEANRVLYAIRGILDRMNASDKRRWYHRSVFLLAWLDHHVFGDSERAKQNLLTLLQMRNTNKQLASFYKTDFEMPGKHYLYLEKYLLLYIDTLAATQDVDGLHLLIRKLKRSSESLYRPATILARVCRAETDTLQSMVRDLNCPKLATDSTGKEHIVLQNALAGADVSQIRAVFRHCRLNRTQFNYARDYARESILSLNSFHQRVRAALAAGTLPAPVQEELAQAQETIEHYLEPASKALALFGPLLEHKKKCADDLGQLSELNDCVADLYALLLSVYSRPGCVAKLPASQDQDIAALLPACRDVTDALVHTSSPTQYDGSFWHYVLFDEARHESSQQYKLLEPLLEFQVNKLVDSVRDALSQPRSDPAPLPAPTAHAADLATNGTSPP